MSKFGGRDVTITGDGNAVGDNNRLTVIKNERHHHHHKPSSKSTDGVQDAGGGLVAIGIAFIVACIGAAYYFALNAQTVYTVLQSLSGVELVAAMPLLYWKFDEEGQLSPKLLTTLALSAFASAVLFSVHSDYRDELTAIAQRVPSAKAFWCSMSDYGRQLALLHVVTAIFGFGASGLLLALSTGSMLVQRFTGFGFEPATRGLYDRFTSWPVVVLGGALLLASAYLHTDDGWKTWASWAGKAPAFFCTPADVYK